MNTPLMPASRSDTWTAVQRIPEWPAMSDTTNVLAYTIPGAVRASGLARTRLYALIETGEVAAFKAGRRTMIRADSLLAHLNSLPPAVLGAGRRTPPVAA